MFDSFGVAAVGKLWSTIEISVKSGKNSTSTPSLVIHRMRLKTKKYISIPGGLKLRKTSNLMVPEFHPVFLFSWAPPQLLHRFSLLLRVQLLYFLSNLTFNKISLLLSTPLNEGLGGERRPKDRLNLQISLIDLSLNSIWGHLLSTNMPLRKDEEY